MTFNHFQRDSVSDAGTVGHIVRSDETGFEALAATFGDRFSRSASLREHHSGLEGPHHGKHPDAVVTAASTSEIVTALAVCRAHGIPVIAHGAGTSLEGHLSAEQGGIVLDLTAMDGILDVDAENLTCRVEAGVTREQLNAELRHHGLFFPLDPGANATLGGMAATRASGTNAVRYGTMRDTVLSLQVVLANGTMIETGTRAAKSAAGYDLTALFVGSEGTLGIITAVTLRLYGLPQAIKAATCRFESLDGAIGTVIAAKQMGLTPARIELLDAAQIAACNSYSNMDMPEAPTLFLEFHGTEAAVDEQADLLGEIASGFGGSAFAVASRTEDRNRLWKARHDAYFATKALRPNARVWSSDVCVPIAALGESILQARKDIDERKLLATIVGHVGDGNFHVLFVLDPVGPEDFALAEAVNKRMVARAISVGGTCTGEHGIGIGKRESLLAERGAEAVGIMATIKAVLDPQAILNPGKIFLPHASGDAALSLEAGPHAL